MSVNTHEKTVKIFVTENLNLATTLLCFANIFLQDVVAQPRTSELRKQGRMARCSWHVGCEDGTMLEELVLQHESLPDGLQVGTKKYEEVRHSKVVGRMLEAQRALNDD